MRGILLRRRHKFNAIKSKCLQGHTHPSKLESQYCDLLAVQKNRGIIKDYEIQKKFDLTVNHHKICRHIVDFVITYPDGKIQCHETKGMVTASWKIKHKLFKALYPNLPYVVVQ